MRVLLITDSNSHVRSESFYLLASELQKKNCEVFILDKAVDKNSRFFNLSSSKKWFFTVGNRDLSYESYQLKYNQVSQQLINDYDLVLLRIDRPVSNEFLHYIQSQFSDSLIINSPEGIIETASKEYLFTFEQFCPDMKLCSSLGEVLEFSKKFPIVLKPLKGYGGQGIYKLSDDRIFKENEEITYEEFNKSFLQSFSEGEQILAVRYLKNISLGDKRILVVNGKIVGAFNRVPEIGSWLANVAQGARYERAEATDREKLMAKVITKKLMEKGVYIYGFDVIKDDDGTELLSEINTLNVGGFYQLDELGDGKAILVLVNETLKKANEIIKAGV